LPPFASAKAEIVRVVVDLRNQPGIFAARFWRDSYRAMLSNAVRGALSKMLLVPLALAALAVPHAPAQLREDLVIAIDLTASVAVTGPDGKSEFQKNVDGVTRVLAQVPINSRITIIGITDHSFAQPYILLSARVGADPGYFGERLTAARNQLVRAWKAKSAQLGPHFRQTDILGALQLASQIFAEQPGSTQKLLVIFSDMRQNTNDLNLESQKNMPLPVKLREQLGSPPILRGVRAFVLGADGAERSGSYWVSLQAFWREYLERTGAELATYSVLRRLDGNGG
jgi:hypothetical protein